MPIATIDGLRVNYVVMPPEQNADAVKRWTLDSVSTAGNMRAAA